MGALVGADVSGYYRELRFETEGLGAHLEAEARLRGLPGVEILHAHHRLLGFFARHNPLIDAYACRVVLAIEERTTKWSRTAHSDPYRDIGEDLITVIRPDVASLIKELDAETAEVKLAYVVFETPPYEGSVRALARREFEALARRCQAQVELSTPAQNLTGERRLAARIRAPVAASTTVRNALRASKFVERDSIKISYG